MDNDISGSNELNTADLLNKAMDNKLAGIHTCLPGKIEKYDPATCKADVKPLLRKRWFGGTALSMPVIANVPVVFPRAGSAALTFPISVGDGVLLIFAERSLDKWLSDGGEVTPDDPRKFDLSDAIAIPGLYPFSESNPDTAGEKLVLQYGGGKLVIDSSGKVALGNSAEELLDLIDDLITLISTAAVVVDPNTGIGAVTAAQFIPIQSRLALIKGTL